MRSVGRWLSMILVGILVLPLAIVTAQEPEIAAPPESYAVVTDQVTEVEAFVIPAGQQAIDLFLAGESEIFYEQMNADFQQLVTVEQLEAALSQLSEVAPIGELDQFRTLALGEITIYAASYDWGSDQLSFSVGFDAAEEIAMFAVEPVFALAPDPSADYENQVEFQLPFDGLWYTFWGGPDPLHNYHVGTPNQRHAYDFVIWQDGSTFTGDGTQVEDYYVYGQPILAPAAGEVLTVVNDLPNVEPRVGSDPLNAAGNHVIIHVAEGEYLMIGHIMPDSIVVEPGDQVAVGQMIGRVGNSGNTSEPHIHIHLQDLPDLYTFDEDGNVTGFTDAIGLPLPYTNYLGNGELVESGEPLGGTFVQNSP